MKTEITIAQIHSAFGQPDRNMEKVLQLIVALNPVHDHLLLLPELWTSGFDLKNCSTHVYADGEILDELALQAAQKKIWIAGSYITQENSAYYNTFVLLGPCGEKIVYRKIHLIHLMNEHHWFQSGKSYTGIKTNFATLGLSICYDLRFPALFQSLAHAGCNVFLLPAAWPISRIDHWTSLLSARAIENQSFLVACNAVGNTHREVFGGSSSIINPWGEVLFQANQTAEVVHTTIIDPDEAASIRKNYPVLTEQIADQEQKIPVQIYYGTGRVNNTEP